MDLKHSSRAAHRRAPPRRRARLPARHRLRRRGAAKPIIGVAITWIETMPCNFHLRALAAQGQGGHPRGRRHADGVQHDRDLRRHHDGHERDEDEPRLPRGDRRLASSWSPAATCSTRVVALSRLRQDDPRRRDGARAPQHPRRHALRRLDHARAATTARTSRSRTSSRPSARTPRARSPTRSSPSSRRHASPGAGACGGQFTANTMAMVFEILGLSPMRLERWSRPQDEAQGRGRLRRPASS